MNENFPLNRGRPGRRSRGRALGLELPARGPAPDALLDIVRARVEFIFLPPAYA